MVRRSGMARVSNSTQYRANSPPHAAAAAATKYFIQISVDGLGSVYLQPMIENSIKHGLEPKPEGGTIDLAAEVRDGKLCVTVTDTGMGFSESARAGVGLANIRERLQQLFGSAGALTIEPNLPGGTRATITVPYAVS